MLEAKEAAGLGGNGAATARAPDAAIAAAAAAKGRHEKDRTVVHEKLPPKQKSISLAGASHTIVIEGDPPAIMMASKKDRLSNKVGKTVAGLMAREKALQAKGTRTAAEEKELAQFPQQRAALIRVGQACKASQKTEKEFEAATTDAARHAAEVKLDKQLNEVCRLAGDYGDQFKVCDIAPPGNVSDAETAKLKSNGGTDVIVEDRYADPPLRDEGVAGGRAGADSKFEEAAVAFEKKLGPVAFGHRRAEEALKHQTDVAKKYISDAVGAWDRTNAKLVPYAARLGSDYGNWSGSVGVQLETIMEVFEKGTLDERMVAVEKFYVEVLGSDLLANAGKSPEKLQEMIDSAEAAGVDGDMLDRRSKAMQEKGGRAGKHDIIDKPKGPAFQEGTAIHEQWHTRARNPGDKRTTETLAEHGIDMSPRAVAFHESKEPGWDKSKAPLWEPGAHVWMMNERDRWVAAQRKLRLPLAAGPSGSTNQYMQTARMLGVKDLLGARLACIGTILPQRHHSLVEILTGASAQGVPFTPGARMYRDIKPLSDSELRAVGAGKFPDEVVEVADPAVKKTKHTA